MSTGVTSRLAEICRLDPQVSMVKQRIEGLPGFVDEDLQGGSLAGIGRLLNFSVSIMNWGRRSPAHRPDNPSDFPAFT
ncbi:MAG: hypothetical protein JSS02_25340 [Planctomycetes bacterium]|nr:hypothetical protein [Planctomycetota bacterium]